MRQDRPFDLAMRIVEMRGDSKAYREAVHAIARTIRAEVRRATKPLKEVVKAMDFSYGRAQSDGVRHQLDEAMSFDPFRRSSESK